MRDGEGGEYFFLFNNSGVAGKVFDHEVSVEDAQVVLSDIPISFRSFSNEVAFSVENISCALWRGKQDSSWSISPNEFASIPFLKFIVGGADYYHRWAQDYYEMDISIEIVRAVFRYGRISKDESERINPNLDLDQLSKDFSEIGGSSGWGRG